MISVPAFSITGESLKVVTLPVKVFGVKADPALLAQAVRIYLGNQRKSSAKTKTRAEVEGSTRKIYRQKGTGRARHGSIRAPIFVGGGIAHGPTGGQNYSAKLPTKMSRKAVLGALFTKVADKQVSIITDPQKASGKTQQTAWLTDLPAGRQVALSTLVVSTFQLAKFNQACRNLTSTDVIYVQQLNTYQILAHRRLFMAQQAVDELTKIYA